MLHATLAPLAQLFEENGNQTPLNILEEDISDPTDPAMNPANSSNSGRRTRAATDVNNDGSLQPFDSAQLADLANNDSDPKNELLPLKKRITVNSNSTCTTLTTMDTGLGGDTPQNINSISQMILHPGNAS